MGLQDCTFKDKVSLELVVPVDQVPNMYTPYTGNQTYISSTNDLIIKTDKKNTEVVYLKAQVLGAAKILESWSPSGFSNFLRNFPELLAFSPLLPLPGAF